MDACARYMRFDRHRFVPEEVRVTVNSDKRWREEVDADTEIAMQPEQPIAATVLLLQIAAPLVSAAISPTASTHSCPKEASAAGIKTALRR